MNLFKRVLAAVVSAATIIAAMSGCANAQTPPAEETVESSSAASVEEIYNRIAELGILPEMYNLEDAYIEGYYGISKELIEDKYFTVAEDSLLADTVIIVKAVSAAEASGMETIFKGINDQRLIELESYNPQQYDRVEKAAIATEGSYVYYLVTDDNEAVIKLIEEYIG